MILSRSSRTFLIIALLPITVAVFYIAYTASQALATPYLPVIVIFLGAVATLAYLVSTIKATIGSEPISRMVLALGIILGVIGYAGLAFLAYGAYQDMIGTHCDGFFNSKSSCTLGPMLILSYLFYQPIVMGIMGILSITAILLQMKVISRANSSRKKGAE